MTFCNASWSSLHNPNPIPLDPPAPQPPFPQELPPQPLPPETPGEHPVEEPPVTPAAGRSRPGKLAISSSRSLKS